ncbi:hypothetical protein LEN26_009598 [Aphanomyces euteiches]|nr:hypothetical protein AeMF1_005693 [Aphanomyces euteiches]KAH9125250.1 hypothetical protein LEN26_009598 [Aphanomyces euteiches]KAH9183131.1 hypothetical protein AeNC1_014893 [Aphanomyces euteiches]
MPHLEGKSVLYYARILGRADIAKELLAHGAFIDESTEDRNFPLFYAANCGHLNVVKVLLQHGATVDVTNYHGKTPLHRASMKGRLAAMDTLVAAGADSTLKTLLGKSDRPVSSNDFRAWVKKMNGRADVITA